jgi:acetyltransferase-like isoleucine patch superfamily enzyme
MVHSKQNNLFKIDLTTTHALLETEPMGFPTGAKLMESRKLMNLLHNVRVKLGPYSYSRENIEILSWGEKADLVVGSFTSIAKGCRCILGGNHRTEWTTTYPFGMIHKDRFTSSIADIQHVYSQTNGSIVIGSDVWIGLNVTIMSGLVIGDGSIIAANSHVVTDVPPYTIYGGNPARFIKDRFCRRVKERLLSLQWWKQDPEIIQRLMPYLQQEPTEDAIRIMQDMINLSNRELSNNAFS